MTKKIIQTHQKSMSATDKGTFYIANSSAFDRIGYDTDRLEEIATNAGADWVDITNQYGWDNQPEVVVFHGTRNVYDNIGEAVNSAYGFVPILQSVWDGYGS